MYCWDKLLMHLMENLFGVCSRKVGKKVLKITMTIIKIHITWYNIRLMHCFWTQRYQHRGLYEISSFPMFLWQKSFTDSWKFNSDVFVRILLVQVIGILLVQVIGTLKNNISSKCITKSATQIWMVAKLAVDCYNLQAIIWEWLHITLLSQKIDIIFMFLHCFKEGKNFRHVSKKL